MIIKSLIDANYNNTYDAFWYGNPGSPGIPRTGGLMKIIRQLDDERNRIVHWHPISHIEVDSSGKNHFSHQTLRPPHFWHRKKLAEPIGEQNLRQFSDKAMFATYAVAQFSTFKYTSLPENLRQALQKICSQPAIYQISNSNQPTQIPKRT